MTDLELNFRNFSNDMGRSRIQCDSVRGKITNVELLLVNTFLGHDLDLWTRGTRCYFNNLYG